MERSDPTPFPTHASCRRLCSEPGAALAGAAIFAGVLLVTLSRERQAPEQALEETAI